MKVLFDHLCFWQKYGGVPRYFIEIMKRLSPESYICTAKVSNNEYLQEIGIYPTAFLPKINFRGKSKIEAELGKLFSIPYILRGNYNIYHQTHYDPYAYKFLPKKIKTVTTIHDLNFYTIPEFYSQNNITKRYMKSSAILADHIITISYNSKQDIINYLECDEDKVSVIYHGIDLEKFSNISKKQKKVPPYILYVGARNKYKNFDGFIRAFSILHHKYTDLKLFCAGKYPSPLEIKLLQKYNILNDTIFLQSTDNELAELYTNALMFVFPSFYEGFGLPILESMAAGCPVVLSNKSCFPEIAGNAGYYFDPYDIDSMLCAMDNVITNSDLRIKMIAEGKERIKNFSWEESVCKHISLYKSLL